MTRKSFFSQCPCLTFPKLGQQDGELRQEGAAWGQDDGCRGDCPPLPSPSAAPWREWGGVGRAMGHPGQACYQLGRGRGGRGRRRIAGDVLGKGAEGGGQPVLGLGLILPPLPVQPSAAPIGAAPAPREQMAGHDSPLGQDHGQEVQKGERGCRGNCQNVAATPGCPSPHCGTPTHQGTTAFHWALLTARCDTLTPLLGQCSLAVGHPWLCLCSLRSRPPTWVGSWCLLAPEGVVLGLARG